MGLLQKNNIKENVLYVSPSDKKHIENTYNRFVRWLKNENLKRKLNQSAVISFEKFSSDNTMTVDGKRKRIIHFNLEYFKNCSVEYFLTIVLHESYHFYINNIPNKIDATRVKDFYYNQMMLHIDVEADYYVAKFLKEETSGFKLKDYLSLYFSGANIFRDTEIRPLKFERFVCSMLTIAHLFEYNELAIHRITSEAILMSQTKPRAILHKAGYSEIKQLELTKGDLNTLINIYQNPNKFNEKKYIDTLWLILHRAVDGHKRTENEKIIWKK